MIRFVPFQADHLHALDLQPAQDEFVRMITEPAYGEMLRRRGFALTAIDETEANGVRVIGCAGVMPQWPGRATAWVLMGWSRKTDWTPIVRRMQGVIGSAHRTGMRRIEATADAGFAPGIRLLQLLGFRLEGTMRAYSPEGRDHHLFAHFPPEDLDMALTSHRLARSAR